VGGLEISALGQGSFALDEGDAAANTRALHRGIELGLTHIDTAEAYGAGGVERFLAKALRGKRSEVFLVSKVHPRNASYEGTIAACERSLARLETEHLDAYLLHWHEGHPMEETFRAFERLRADGKIRSWGVSNFELSELEQALAIVGEGKLACNQIEYFLGQRRYERDLMPFCRAHGITIVGHSPFGDTRFPKPESPEGQLLSRLGAQVGLTPRALAIAFLLRDGAATIPKTSKIPHLEDNARGASVVLPAEILAELDRAFPAGG